MRTRRDRIRIGIAAVALALAAALASVRAGVARAEPDAAAAQTVAFAGYQWTVRTGTGGPGWHDSAGNTLPNTWSADNVRVDADGLHLQARPVGGVWSCAEVESTVPLGFGTYQFQVIGRPDQFDPAIVLGLFNYPGPGQGKDGTNEIDIEFSRWGEADNPIGNYTVWPAKKGPKKHPLKQATHGFDFTLDGTYTTHRFQWSAAGVRFQSLNGHRDDNQFEFQNWEYAPQKARKLIPQHPLPVHLNLWLFKLPPSDGQPVDVVISDFKFTPAPNPARHAR